MHTRMAAYATVTHHASSASWLHSVNTTTGICFSLLQVILDDTMKKRKVNKLQGNSYHLQMRLETCPMVEALELLASEYTRPLSKTRIMPTQT